MAKIGVIGVGYVGLVTAASFADLGNEVYCVDIDGRKIERLQRNELPFYEPGLKELVSRNAEAGRLAFTTRYEEAIPGCDFVFICVGTPMTENGAAELRYVRMAAESIGPYIGNGYTIVINKSTVPIGTGDLVTEILSQYTDPTNFAVVSNPEFLREGSAVSDFFNPDRIVLGAVDRQAAERVAELHAPLNAPIIITDLHTAEMIKYASNAFLATRISFINEMAHICEKLGADVKEVARGMGMDKRIGPHFLNAGVGYGGSCFAGDEVVFLVNPPSFQPRTFEDLFAALEKDDRTTVGPAEVRFPDNWQVLSFDPDRGQPTLARVRCVTCRPYDGPMVRLRTRMGRRLKVTADHPVLLYRPERDAFEVVLAGQVQEGDLLATPIASFPFPPPAQINLLQELEDHPLANSVLIRPADERFRELDRRIVRAVPRSLLRYPDDIFRHNYMPLRVYRHLRKQGLLPEEDGHGLRLYTTKGRPTYCPAILDLDERFLRLLGYYLAEGWISTDEGRRGGLRERVGFTFGLHEETYIADLEGILQQYGIRFTRRVSGRSLTVLVSSRVLAVLFRDLLRLGTDSYDKRLPPFALALDEAGRRALLRGLWSGDGTITRVNNGRHLYLGYATVSRPLAEGVVLLLQSLGLVPSLARKRMNKSTVPAYILRIAGRAQVERAAALFAEKQEEMQSLCGRYQRRIAPPGFRRQGSLALLQVSAVAHFYDKSLVYSLETDNGILLGNDGLIVHNCFPKDVRALAYMAERQDCHPQLLQAVMAINQAARERFVQKLVEVGGDLQGRTVGVLGLSFKPNTDDMREAPSITIIEQVRALGAEVKAYDPAAMARAEELMPWVTYCATPYDVAKGADALLVVTEWNEFKQLDMERVRDLMRRPLLLDGRNIYDPEEMRRLGFVYYGVGRP